MHLVAPDILAAGKGLSETVCAAGIGLGVLLWLFGGRGLRFLQVLLITLAAGVYGLSVGERHAVQPLVAGLLLAVAAGALALALVKVLAFVGGGAAACVLADRLMPVWDEPFIFFFVGGFLGLWLVRYWMTALCSLAGTLLTTYSTLWLLDDLGRLDAAGWAAAHQVPLDWACGGAAVLGFLIQLYLQRRPTKQADKEKKSESGKEPSPRRLWWWGGEESKRDRRAA